MVGLVDVIRETLPRAKHLTAMPTRPVLLPPVVGGHVAGVLHKIVEDGPALTADEPAPCVLPVVQEHGQFPAQLQPAEPAHELDVLRHLHSVLQLKVVLQLRFRVEKLAALAAHVDLPADVGRLLPVQAPAQVVHQRHAVRQTLPAEPTAEGAGAVSQEVGPDGAMMRERFSTPPAHKGAAPATGHGLVVQLMIQLLLLLEHAGVHERLRQVLRSMKRLVGFEHRPPELERTAGRPAAAAAGLSPDHRAFENGAGVLR